MNGLLLIDKPSGWTSFDVVAKVRSTLRQSKVESLNVKSGASLDVKTLRHLTFSPKVKVGHTGTLDPLATGLLILVIGNYTKRASEFSKLDKTYEVTMKLGFTSTTGDEEGVKQVASDKIPSIKEIEAVFKQFNGEIMQAPPAYSAIKVNGQRAYKLARAGKSVVLEPRKVVVYRLEVIDYTYPEVKFMAQVSSGTYIRSLVEDIGKKLGTGAYMFSLRRTQVGNFGIKNALAIEGLDTLKIKNNVIKLDHVS